MDVKKESVGAAPTAMRKDELVAAIVKRANINKDQAQIVVNETIAELVSPAIFQRPGEEVGFINDNHCTNNCPKKEALEGLVNPVVGPV